MAATKRNAMIHEEARKKIQTTQLINRLTNHAFGKNDMTSTQVSAALGLLKKALPDLQATQISGEVNHNYVAEVPEVSESVEEWQQQAKPTIQ